MTLGGRGKALAIVGGVGALVVGVVAVVGVDWDSMVRRYRPDGLVGTWEQTSIDDSVSTRGWVGVHRVLWCDEFTVAEDHKISFEPVFFGGSSRAPLLPGMSFPGEGPIPAAEPPPPDEERIRFSVEGSKLTLHESDRMGGKTELSVGFSGFFGSDRLWLQGDGTARYHYRRRR